MAATVVPAIYDHLTKKVLRWYLLDSESQLLDPAFKPAHPNERMLKIPLQIYKAFGKSGSGIPALGDIQNYVNGNAP